MDHVHGSYNLFLVALSYIIAVTASYSALDLAGRIVTSRGKARSIWLGCGAVSMGLGIWSMHFVGMLAFSLPMDVSYKFGPFVMSVLLAIAVSSVALHTVSGTVFGAKQLVAASALMAAGISGMHYIGMAAMTVQITYNPMLVALSVAIAIAASLAALWLLYVFRKNQSRYVVLYKLGCGTIMGAAIAGMHYTGMAAATFRSGDGPTGGGMRIEPGMLALIISAGILLTLGFTLFSVYVNKRLSQKDSAIKQHKRWYRSLYENNSDGIISIDTQGKIISFNPAASILTGFTEAGYKDAPIASLGSGIAGGLSADSSYETTFVRNDNSRVELSVNPVPVEIDGEAAGTHLLIKDITEEKRSKEMIHYLAYHDELTGLPNRRKFNQLLAEAIEDGERRGSRFSVMILDIDRFKLINDSLGHTYGDMFLKEVSERLLLNAEGFDVSIARMGGDEFTILCRSGQEYSGDTARLADRIIRSVQVPYRIKDNDYYVTASIGIAAYPDHGLMSEILLRNADTAMYEVKKHGKNGYRYYSRELDSGLAEKMELEADLRKALERDELTVHYQPQFDTSDRSMIGIEALVRWNHPARGLLYPKTFIPLAEETGLIYDLGTWVLREACRQMKDWHDGGGPRIPVSVNLSSLQFHQNNLVGYVTRILEETGLAPEYLVLEITESMMMDPATSKAILDDLARLGIRISLDDFGTGYSSLSYLRQFPIHKLKIDRSFIADITMNDNDKAIVETIISMARHLNMNVIAEGIETEDQLEILKANACKEIQGYYFSRPLPPDEVEKTFWTPIQA
ncbi:EAL domain-containing protein [Paenibacillus sp. GCM10012303]|uniref:bifunctional diguanylate cyclase/phosphodiesterase n=1 Tax=Paenibacillus sp. GCM10012303 TaxID=3317340 RepID=UPI0036147448